MSRKIKWPGESRRYAQLQQNDVDKEFVYGEDVNLVLRHVLPSEFLSSFPVTGCGMDVLDVGSGIGRAVYHMHKQWVDARYWLLDGEGEKQHAGINHMLKDDTFYSNAIETAYFLRANGVNNFFQIRYNLKPTMEFLAELTDQQIEVMNSPMVVEWGFVGATGVTFDLVTSFRAVGFHWPMHPMLDLLADVTVGGSILLFESRPLSRRAYLSNERWNAGRELVIAELKAIADHGCWDLLLFKHIRVGPHLRSYVLAERL